MASVRLSVKKGVWMAINNESKEGVIELIQGDIVLTQQSTIPTTTLHDTARNGRMNSSGQERRYVVDDEFIYAFGVADSIVDVTTNGER